MYPKLSKTQTFQFRRRPAVPGTEWSMHRKICTHPYGSLRLSNSSLLSIYEAWGGGTYFSPLPLSKKGGFFHCEGQMWIQLPPAGTWDTFGKRQQAATGQSLLHHPPTPQEQKQQFLWHPHHERKKRKINSNPRIGLGSSLIAKIAVSALVLPNGFSPSDPGVDYFFSINPGGRREKFSSSQGHLALETEENAEQEKQLGWERERGREKEQLSNNYTGKETLAICSKGLSHRCGWPLKAGVTNAQDFAKEG